MKKILAAICALCAVVSLAAFAACDSNGGETSVDSSTVESSVTDSSTVESSVTDSSTVESSVTDSSTVESSVTDSSSVTVDYQINVNTTEAVVFKATSDVLTLTESTSLKDYLDALVAAGQITYDGYVSDYGYYITTVNGNAEQYYDTYMTYWSVYTDLLTLDGVTYATTDYGSYDNSGTTLGSASYGVSALPCVEGYTYALVYSTYTY